MFVIDFETFKGVYYNVLLNSNNKANNLYV